MKFSRHLQSPVSQSRRGQAGMTLVEMVIAGALMTLVVGFVMTAQFIGLRQDQLMESKAGIDDHSRLAISKMLYDIKAAKGYDIGNASAGNNFAVIANGNLMQGNALQLYTSVIYTNQAIVMTNFLTVYYYDTNNAVLWRWTSGVTNTTTMVATNLISPFVFYSENWTGAVQSVRTYKGIVHTTLQFRQFQYPVTQVGTNGIFDYYRIDCRATPHLPDGS
jgi:hypothetical protein